MTVRVPPDVNPWQVAHIKQALEEARSGTPGILHEDVERWMDLWGSADELPAPDLPACRGETIVSAGGCGISIAALPSRPVPSWIASAMAYWLVKSEPDSFSWDQQVAKRVEPWTGV